MPTDRQRDAFDWFIAACFDDDVWEAPDAS